MLKQEQVKTPELKKMQAVQDKSQAIGEFLEWLNGEHKIQLMKKPMDKCEDCYECEDCGGIMMEYANMNIKRMLADFFEIDLGECEQECQTLLDAIQEDNK